VKVIQILAVCYGFPGMVVLPANIRLDERQRLILRQQREDVLKKMGHPVRLGSNEGPGNVALYICPQKPADNQERTHDIDDRVNISSGQHKNPCAESRPLHSERFDIKFGLNIFFELSIQCERTYFGPSRKFRSSGRGTMWEGFV
jgi:hypothetical protein